MSRLPSETRTSSLKDEIAAANKKAVDRIIESEAILVDLQPANIENQEKTLRDAGVVLEQSNASAALVAARIALRGRNI